MHRRAYRALPLCGALVLAACAAGSSRSAPPTAERCEVQPAGPQNMVGGVNLSPPPAEQYRYVPPRPIPPDGPGQNCGYVGPYTGPMP